MLPDGVKGANGVMDVDEPSIVNAEDEDHYGYTFEGYINVPQAGIYTFYTKRGQHLEWGWITPIGTSDQKISKELLFNVGKDNCKVL